MKHHKNVMIINSIDFYDYFINFMKIQFQFILNAKLYVNDKNLISFTLNHKF